ncbi:hypothetical protein CONPUDRAFT_74640 [Coniophora puteana RWD-64-598 SS2]|uniref:CxC2-like cysteine cluster KDZ transposase-associated domain-containing protein n=1 Tax=Coniophora puteana (strain RWD-64-598) TaxID=741705 RepID=A0A5M3MJM4_CONPW|nr:uncharacterized protein CONPUDRAFT_74640 [Coniophora puteana RWD-64-598 SS2]EIW79130.1 hypothetical protein CONPUDRAFT_74640 [Coniophora puteana RWD-64-598 SS2]
MTRTRVLHQVLYLISSSSATVVFKEMDGWASRGFSHKKFICNDCDLWELKKQAKVVPAPSWKSSRHTKKWPKDFLDLPPTPLAKQLKNLNLNLIMAAIHANCPTGTLLSGGKGKLVTEKKTWSAHNADAVQQGGSCIIPQQALQTLTNMREVRQDWKEDRGIYGPPSSVALGFQCSCSPNQLAGPSAKCAHNVTELEEEKADYEDIQEEVEEPMDPEHICMFEEPTKVKEKAMEEEEQEQEQQDILELINIQVKETEEDGHPDEALGAIEDEEDLHLLKQDRDETMRIPPPSDPNNTSCTPAGPHTMQEYTEEDEKIAYQGTILDDVRTAQAYIDLLKSAHINNADYHTLSNSACYRLCNPPCTIVDLKDDQDKHMSIDYRLRNWMPEDYRASCRIAERKLTGLQTNSYHNMVKEIEKITGVDGMVDNMCINTCTAYTAHFSILKSAL